MGSSTSVSTCWMYVIVTPLDLEIDSLRSPATRSASGFEGHTLCLFKSMFTALLVLIRPQVCIPVLLWASMNMSIHFSVRRLHPNLAFGHGRVDLLNFDLTACCLCLICPPSIYFSSVSNISSFGFER